MSDYLPTLWENETPDELPLRYTLRAMDGSIIAEGATIELMTPVVPGTPIDAAHLNHIEQGLATVDSQVSAVQVQADSLQAQINTGVPKIFAAKGDLAVGTGLKTGARLAIGANNYVLTANSGASGGISWLNRGVTNGDAHDHNGGDGGQIDHATLANKGTNTHAQIDSHIASGSTSGHVTGGNTHDHNGGDGAQIDHINLRNVGTTTGHVTNGNAHDHAGGDGGQIDHINLANKGSNTHAQIDSHIADGTGHIPIGGIILWSGLLTAIPAGWALCNGSNGTPDLRDRFIVGAGGAYAKGATGGAATVNLAHTHTTDSIGSHNHANSFRSEIPYIENGIASISVTPGEDMYTFASANHTHIISQNTNSGGAHTHSALSAGSSSQSILPPYIALGYIMRIS